LPLLFKQQGCLTELLSNILILNRIRPVIRPEHFPPKRLRLLVELAGHLIFGRPIIASSTAHHYLLVIPHHNGTAAPLGASCGLHSWGPYVRKITLHCLCPLAAAHVIIRLQQHSQSAASFVVLHGRTTCHRRTLAQGAHHWGDSPLVGRVDTATTRRSGVACYWHVTLDLMGVQSFQMLY